MLFFIFFLKKIISRIFINMTLGNFRTQKWPNVMLRKSGKCCLNKKIKVTIQPGIQKAPMQALTALCGTNIVAATAIQK